MPEYFNNDLQKSAKNYLDSKTRLNDFYLLVGIGSVVAILIYGPKLLAAIGEIMGSKF